MTITTLPTVEGSLSFGYNERYFWTWYCHDCRQRNQRMGGNYGEAPEHMLGDHVKCKYCGSVATLTEKPKKVVRQKARVRHGGSAEYHESP